MQATFGPQPTVFTLWQKFYKKVVLSMKWGKLRSSHTAFCGSSQRRMISLRGFVMLFCVLPLGVMAQEICANGIDDDADALIDLNDPDCPCATALVGAAGSYIRNHSFEDHSCCPFGYVTPLGQPWLDCSDGWHQATFATSDYFHECGYSPVGFNLPPPDGEGAVGFFAYPGYFEYVGTCLTFPLPANPLVAGTTYTVSLWISTAIANEQQNQSLAQGSYTAPFTDRLPLAIFGHANACVPFPISTQDCIGFLPEWVELGRVDVQLAWEWARVSITFTPTQDIHSIMIGGACDTPASLGTRTITDPATGDTYSGVPYYIVDELLLTIATDQVLQPVSTTGSLCTDDAMAVAQPPTGATNYQWYLDGVAIPNQTGSTLDVSEAGLEGGTYAMSSLVDGQCLLGSADLPPAILPVPRFELEPTTGCAPLTVHFADTTGLGHQTVLWTLGDGNTRTDSSFTHVYTTAGTFDVALTVRNDAGCTADTLLPDAITVHPAVNGAITINPDPVLAEDPVTQVSGTAGGTILSWWWDLGVATPATATTQNVNATFPATPGAYPIMLVVNSAAGCVDTVRSIVTVIDPGVIEMPNVFSPNADGRNDRFLPLDAEGAAGLLEIYNRWGQMVFSTRSLAQGWSGSDVPDGTYYYVVIPDAPSADKLTGHVTLVR